MPSHTMGGISTAYEAPFGASLNFSNPAANTKVSTTLFSTNVTLDQMNFSGRRVLKYQNTFYFSNISLGFPLREKTILGFGYQPYTGYYNRMYGPNSAQYQFDEERKIIKGSGGLNSFHAFLRYKIDNNWSVGLRGNYLFGSLTNQYLFYTSPDLSQVALQEDRINGINLTAGIFSIMPSATGRIFSAGATYGFGKKMTVKRTMNRFNTLNGDTEQGSWTTETVTENIPLRLPMSASLGFSYREDNKWMLSTQYDWKKTSELEAIKHNTPGLDEAYRNSQKFSVGGYWIPQYNSYKNYLDKIIYRFGLYYKNTELYINHQGISDYGLTLGIGLPIRKRESEESTSYLNIGLALGQRGSTKKNLTRERYFSAKIDFSFGAKWFQKRIYD
ncbi:MAG: hypothetical protein ACMUEL_00525 [Flavobacteriales bacterium Tduv]